jgi:hypothetical protein
MIKKIFLGGAIVAISTPLLATLDREVVAHPTQPIGTLVRTYTPTGPLPFPVQPPPPANPFPLPTTPISEVNYICAQWDSEEIVGTEPFDINYPATEIILTQPQHFVRLLGESKSSPNGAWIMRSEYVRGRTPAELRDIFALPAPPIDICNVEMPASPDPVTGKDYVLWTGIAGPIRGPGHDWGDGGSAQNRLVADYGTHYFPNYLYTSSSTRNHRQPIGTIALSYQPLAGDGNNGRVAKYLDTCIPKAYSDLERVYDNLDYINYVPYGSTPIQDALYQIGPERFDALSFLHIRNAILFSNAFFDQQLVRQWTKLWYPCGESTCGCNCNCNDYAYPTCILQAVGEFDTKKSSPYHNPLRNKTGGFVGSGDVFKRPDLAIGIAFAGMGNRLHWDSFGGSIHGGTAKAGIYADYFSDYFFADGLVWAGGTWNSTSRPISFYGVERTAESHQHGVEAAACLQAGFTRLAPLMPVGRLSYFFNKQNHFTETGADSLNLKVKSFHAHTVRLYLGLEFTMLLDVNPITIMPQASVAWARDTVIGNRRISAQLPDIGGSLSVYGAHDDQNYIVGNAGFTCLLAHCSALFVQYTAEVRDNLTAQALEVALQVSF